MLACVVWPSALPQVLGLGAALAVTGCDEPVAGQGQALKTALAAAAAAALETRVEPEDLPRPEEWRRTANRSFAHHAGRLGGLRLKVTASYTLSPQSGAPLRLTDERSADLAVNGDFSVAERSTWVVPDEKGEGAQRCWRLGGHLYHARATGPASRFEARAGEAERCLDAAVEPVQAWLRTFADRAAVEAEPGPPVLGHETVRVRLTLREGGATLPAALPLFWRENEARTASEETPGVPGPRAWLVASHGALRHLDGDLQLDAATGLPLQGRLTARLALQKAGQGGELALQVDLAAAPRSGPVERPEEVVETGPRARIFKEREKLLGEQFKGGTAAPLPKPGDAPPLVMGPGDETTGSGEPASEPPSPGKPAGRAGGPR